MKFKLDLSIDVNPLLDYKKPVLSIGSCFADQMASKLTKANFQVLANPFGTLYNPISIVENLEGTQTQATILEHNGMFHSMKHHGDLSHENKSELLDGIASAQQSVASTLSQPKLTVLITFGTADVFTLDGEVVANCHKIPASMFAQRLLSVKEIVASWTPLLNNYPNHDFVFTISPVRYTKSGLHKNNISKGILHAAVHEIVQSFANAHYFPAYEIVVDELRDYRFYEEDLVHPNHLAVQYVWDKVQAYLFTERTQKMYKALQVLKQMEGHRLLHPNSDAAKKFVINRESTRQQFIEAFGPLLT